MTITPSMLDPSQKDVRIGLLKDYLETRQHSLDLCRPLEIDDYGAQPMADVSPPKWHLAHTTWFFETFILKPFSKAYKVFDAQFNYLFNSYYNGVGSQYPRPLRGAMTRPTLAQVLAYRGHVDEAMIRLLSFDQSKDIQDLVVLGCHHEQQHQELLLTDIKFILGQNPVHAAYLPESKPASPSAAEMTFTSHHEGVQEIGFAGKGFHFDNEAPLHQVFINPFCIANRLVTNGEYLAFMEAGGYQAADHWLSEGWTWKNQNNIQAPLYWVKRDEAWFEYHLHGGLQKLDLNAPVMHVSFFEADAYASFAGKRLPTEFEWEMVAKTKQNALNEIQKQASPNFDAKRWFRNVWQWTSSAYAPYPGFKPFKGLAAEYNGKFMCNQIVLRGGSIATPAEHLRISYRNFFYAPDRWQFTGILLADTE